MTPKTGEKPRKMNQLAWRLRNTPCGQEDECIQEERSIQRITNDYLKG